MNRFKNQRLLFIGLFLGTACQPSERTPTVSQPLARHSGNTNTPHPAVHADGVLPNKTEAQTASLEKSLALTPAPQQWKMLDSLACLADGAGSEAISLSAVNLWTVQLQSLTAYLMRHPKSCLRRSLVWGMSENLTVFVGEARAAALISLKKETSQRASKDGLTPAEQQYCKMILADVKPELFD
ncbi:MAG TPA: hypothetical protein VF629_05640 [Hymenobacter sp.]|jgi:hypothetical protein|uniref:hypothetical protein n=1 Tax=Hymenobacter sp. TaxID=1898978 RepID=UPI002EDA7B3D